jgi:acetoacetyl-CoA synthetase
LKIVVVGGSLLLPVYAGEIQAKCLGMAVDTFDPIGERSRSIEVLSQPGELVCTRSFPSQPLAFSGTGKRKGIVNLTSYASEMAFSAKVTFSL